MYLRSHFKKDRVKTVMLTLTHKCNLSCVYCYENTKDNAMMSKKTAFSIIDDEMNKNSDIDFIEFDLFGGEPFINFDLIKSIVNHLKKGSWNKKWICFATTNGTLVNKDIQNWLIKNRDFIICCLSLDGTPEMHNTNRSNSFEKIDINFFQETYPTQPVKMTISPNSLNDLANGIIYMQKMGFLVSANLAYGIDWCNENNNIVYEEQLLKLIDFYVKNPKYPICKLLDLDISIVGKTIIEEFNIKKYCGAGTTFVSYDTNGKRYACHMFMPVSTGEYKAENSIRLNFTSKYDIKKLDDKCQNCIVNRVCPTCIGMNYRETGSLYKKDEPYCKLMKIQLKAISVLKFKQWKNGILSLNIDEEYALLKAISLIQNNL